MSACEMIRFGELCEIQILRIVHLDGTVVSSHRVRPLMSPSESSDDSGFEEGSPDQEIPDIQDEASNLVEEASAETQAPSLPLQNIREMSLEQRKALLSTSSSRTVTILADNIEMMKIPLEIFQVMSSKASEVDLTDNQAPVFRIPHDLPNGPFVHIRDWLKNNFTTSVNMPFLPSAKTIKNNTNNNELKQDLSIIRAAELMGMEDYTKHIFGRYWRLLCSDDITTPDDISKVINMDELAAIHSLALSETDPFLAKLVKRLGWSIHKNAISNSFVAYIDAPEHARLRTAVDIEIARINDVENQHRAAKEAENRRKFQIWQKNEERRERLQADFERKKKERKERNEKAKEGAASKRD